MCGRYELCLPGNGTISYYFILFCVVILYMLVPGREIEIRVFVSIGVSHIELAPVTKNKVQL